jgi:hypothetical protein
MARMSLGARSRACILPGWLSPRFHLTLIAIAIVAVPFSLRIANRLALDEFPQSGYLPSLEIRRAHKPFEEGLLESVRYGGSRWVFIGDSMLGTRVDPAHLGAISSDGTERVQMVMAPATGPSWWFLALKNIVAASGVKPRCTFIFFRDANLTDTMFRLESQYGNFLDLVARDFEPELDRLVAARRRGIWMRVYSAANQAYELDLARTWMEPAIRQWFTHYRFPSGRGQEEFDLKFEEHFGLDHLRADVGSDVGTLESTDFDRDLPTSVLPDLIQVAREHDLPLCFVRVQRRPLGNKPPEQTPQLRAYVARLKTWIEAHGALFHDDTGDPEMTLDLYEDGDHFLDRRRYTEILRQRLDPIFRDIGRTEGGLIDQR